MKICLLNIVPIATEYLPATLEIARSSFGRVLNTDTDVEIRAPAKGLPSNPEFIHDYRNPYFCHLVVSEIIDTALKVEAEGFDAIVINCFDDPAVAEARAVVNIPVFGLCEPTLHYASQLGNRLGVLVPDMPGQVAFVEAQFHQHGLGGRLITNGVRAESKDFKKSLPEGMQNPQLMTDRLSLQAEQLVRDGADVIVIACGGLGQVCGMAGWHALSVDGKAIPIVLPLTVAMKHAEMMLTMQAGLGIPVHSCAHAGGPLADDDRQRIQQGFGKSVT